MPDGPAAPPLPAPSSGVPAVPPLEAAAHVAALDALADGLVVVDRELRVLYANAALAAEVGHVPTRAADDLLEAAGWQLRREDGRTWPAAQRPLQQALRGSREVNHLVQLVHPDGRERWLRVTAVPLRRAGEQDPWAAVGIYRDVTERQLARKALADSEAHFRLLAENSTDVIQRHTVTGSCLYSSPSLLDVLGWRPEDVQGTSYAERVHPADLALLTSQVRELIRDLEPTLVRYRAKRAGGGWTWVETLARAVRARDGRVHEVQTSTRDVSERVAADQRLARLALTDPLTGLANRASLVQHLEDLVAGDRQIALLFLDLDRFKVVNDSLGHSAGDELLRVIAGRLSGVCRDGDVVARLGGDEFVVAAAGLDEDGAVELAGRVQRVLATPISVVGHELVMSASVGIVASPPGRHEDAEDLLRDADASMYRAKARGRAGSVVWSAASGRSPHAVSRLSVESDLREAIGAGALDVVYQPQVELATSRVVAVEALVRWPHPTRGVLLPAQFLDVAEDAGLLAPLGELVLGRAVPLLAQWRRLPGAADLGLAVNLAAQELREPGRLDWTLALLAEHGLPPAVLTVEVPESVLLDDEPTAAEVLGDYARAGVRVALDDFGTGGTALRQVRRVPVGVVKIAPEFVAGIGSLVDRAVVRAVLSLTRDLGLACVAEGVEQPAQRDWLVRQGVDLGQGDALHPPTPAAEVPALLAPSG